METVETYRDGVCKTCDAVDGNIKSMYQVCEALTMWNLEFCSNHDSSASLNALSPVGLAAGFLLL